MNALQLSLGAAALLALAATSKADNCDYTRGKVESYKAMCRSTGDCQTYQLMQQILVQECGADAPPQVQVHAKPKPPASRDSGAATVKAPTLQGGSAYDKAVQQQKARENDPYNGEACAYFTRDAVERKDGSVSLQYHGNNHRVCYQGRMYQCVNHRWQALNECTEYPGWKERQAEKVEKNVFE